MHTGLCITLRLFGYYLVSKGGESVQLLHYNPTTHSCDLLLLFLSSPSVFSFTAYLFLIITLHTPVILSVDKCECNMMNNNLEILLTLLSLPAAVKEVCFLTFQLLFCPNLV